jgi:hypothetical protein
MERIVPVQQTKYYWLLHKEIVLLEWQLNRLTGTIIYTIKQLHYIDHTFNDLLPYLVTYFGVIAIFDPVDWIDPNHSGQTTQLSSGFWHGQPYILLNVKDYPRIIDLGRQLAQLQYSALAFGQLVAIARGQQTTTNVARRGQTCRAIEPNDATIRYNRIQT